MKRISRRSFILTGICGGGTVLAGCSSISNSDGGSGSGSTREQVINSRAEIAEDEYQYFSFDLNQQASFEYGFTVRSGPEIDVFLLDDLEFNEFQAGNRFKSYSTESGIGGGDSMILGEDSYRLVVDNTTAGKVSPPTNLQDDIAEVEVEAWLEG